MSVNPPDISIPLLLLAPADWPAAMRGEYLGAALILDLHPQGHTAVSPDTVKTLLAFLQQVEKTPNGHPVLVRIGGFGGGFAERDVTVLKNGRPQAILLSACRNVADIQKLDVVLTVFEAEGNLPIGSTAILAECGAEAEFFLSPHSLAGKSARLRGLVLNAQALSEITGSEPDAYAQPAPLSFARAVCVLKAAEARVPCYEMLPPEIGPVEMLNAQAESKANGFDNIVVSPAHLAARLKGTTEV